MKKLLASTALAAIFASADVPTVSNVIMTQDLQTRKVTIEYELEDDTPAIITLDIQVDGASIGDKNITYLTRDVNKIVQGKGKHYIEWEAAKSWPDNRTADKAAKAVVTAWDLSTPPDYMVVNLLLKDDVRYYTSADALPEGGLANDIYRKDLMVLRKCPAAGVTWTMGGGAGEAWWSNDEATRTTKQTVQLPEDYFIGVYTVTQWQWWRITGQRPFKTDTLDTRPTRTADGFGYNVVRLNATPETSVGIANTANDSNYFWPKDPHPSSFLGQIRAKTGVKFDLPSEAQWEFACRAGNTTALGQWGDGSSITTATGVDDNLARLGRYNKNKEDFDPKNTHCEVGKFEPNNWGLYDMHGNVSEYCLDFWEACHIYTEEEKASGWVNVTEPSNGHIVFKGGGYSYQAGWQTAGWRFNVHRPNANNNVGIRLATPVRYSLD